jgi:LmbE family N-acetylglucosaminyl deacetylase
VHDEQHDERTRALVVTAHPDDVDFGAAGTVATLTDEGWAVSYCVITDGDAGGFDPSVERAEIPRIRRAEQTEAARLLGVDDLHWLGYADGRLEPSLELRRDLARVIRTVRPARVICMCPQRLWDSGIGRSHPDHLAAGEATLRAVYPDARNPFAFPELAAEGLDAHVVSEVWVMGGPEPDHAVDVTDRFDRKLAALRAHQSQEVDRDGGLEARLRSWMGATAAAAGLPAGRLAETFRRLATG